MRKHFRNSHIGHLIDQRRVSRKIDDTVVIRACRKHPFTAAGRPDHQYSFDFTEHVTADFCGVVIDFSLQSLQTLELHAVRRFIGQTRSRRARTRTIDKAKASIKSNINQPHRLLEIFSRFSRESDDKVRRNGNTWACSLQTANDGFVFEH